MKKSLQSPFALDSLSPEPHRRAIELLRCVECGNPRQREIALNAMAEEERLFGRLPAGQERLAALDALDAQTIAQMQQAATLTA